MTGRILAEVASVDRTRPTRRDWASTTANDSGLPDNKTVRDPDVNPEHIKPVADFAGHQAATDDFIAVVFILELEGRLKLLILASSLFKLRHLVAQSGVFEQECLIFAPDLGAFKNGGRTGANQIRHSKDTFLDRFEDDGKRAAELDL